MMRIMTSHIRNDLKQIFGYSVGSVKPDNLIRSHIAINDKHELIVKDSVSNQQRCFSLKDKEIYIIGAGKAVLKMCEEFLRTAAKVNDNGNASEKLRINKGVLSVPIGSIGDSCILDKFNVKYLTGAKDNLPDEDAMKTTREIMQLIETAKNDNLDKRIVFITFISGGGSALLTYPKPSMSLQSKCAIINKLVKCGSTINELNKVRQCLSLIKSGKLAKLALANNANVELVSLIVSDIIGDPITLIASGPTVFSNNNTKCGQDAFKILSKHTIEIEQDVRQLILEEDNMKDVEDSEIKRVSNIIIGNNFVAMNAAKEKAEQLGYKVIDLGNDMQGEAEEVARKLADIGIQYDLKQHEKESVKGICWIAGGETTVKLNNSDLHGKGGRCQHMCLEFYNYTKHYDEEKLVLMAAGTDGQDGPTSMAGCIAESGMKDALQKECDKALATHDSHNFWKCNYADWLVDTNGPTGTNVMDIYCLVKLIKQK